MYYEDQNSLNSFQCSAVQLNIAVCEKGYYVKVSSIEESKNLNIFANNRN